MSATLTIVYNYTPSAADPGVLVIRRDLDGYFFDDFDDAFRAVPTTGYVIATESATVPGLYSWSISQSWDDGLYQVLWYASSAMDTMPEITSIVLANFLVVDQVTDIENAVADNVDYMQSVFNRLFPFVSAEAMTETATIGWDGDSWPTGCKLSLEAVSFTRQSSPTPRFYDLWDHGTLCNLVSDGAGGVMVEVGSWAGPPPADHLLGISDVGWSVSGPMPAGTLTITSAGTAGTHKTKFKIRIHGGTKLEPSFVGKDGELYSHEGNLLWSIGDVSGESGSGSGLAEVHVAIEQE